MFVVVAIGAEQLPVAAVRRIVIVIVVFVMDCQFSYFFAGEFPSAFPANPREDLERPLPVTLLSEILITLGLGNELGSFITVSLGLYDRHSQKTGPDPDLQVVIVSRK